MNFRRWLTVFVVVALCLPLSGALAQEQNDLYSFPLEEQATIRYAVYDNYYTPKSYALNLPVFEELEKLTNVKIEWDCTQPSSFGEVMNTRLAAGVDLPDIITGFIDWDKFIAAEMFVPIDGLIEERGYYIQQLFEEMPSVKGVLTRTDGHIYNLGSIAQNDFVMSWIIREDWLEQCGLDLPTTTEEFYEALKAFQEQNVNGTGDAVFAMGNHWELDRISEAWGLHLQWSGGFYPDEDGNIIFEQSTQSYKEYLAYLNRLYSEGLLDPNIANTSTDHFNALVTDNKVGASMAWIGNIVTLSKLAQSKDEDAYYACPVPVAGPYGATGFETRGPIGARTGITKSAEDPALCLQWLDYLFASPTGRMLANYGIEGVTYDMVDGEPVMRVDDVLAMDGGLQEIGAAGNYPLWPIYDANRQLNATDPKLSAANEALGELLFPNYPGGALAMTPEEQKQKDRYWTDIDTYVGEMRMKFILGQESLDKFDEFVDKLYEMGLEQVLEVEQAKYDRYKAAM